MHRIEHPATSRTIDNPESDKNIMTLDTSIRTAMKNSLKVSAALLLALLCTVPVAGQEIEEQGLLYFPPKLKVHASITSNIRPRPDRMQDKETDGLEIKRRATPETEDILPMVFFDGAGSIAIPNRYQTFVGSSQTETYADTNEAAQMEDLREDILKYYEVLNILGYRMKNRYPESRIELEGGYSTLPGEDAEVGAARAEVIRDYLTSIWKIGKERIALAPPRQACDSADHIQLQQEAQRVAITTSDSRLFRYVSFDKVRSRDIILFFDFTIDPSMAPEEVAGLEIIITADDKLLSRTEVPGNPDSSLYRLQGIWPGFWLNAESPDALTVRASVRTTAGKTRSADPVRIPISYKRNERVERPEPEYFRLDGFAVPFFEYRDSSLGAAQQGQLGSLVHLFREIQPIMRENGTTAYITIQGGAHSSERQEISEDIMQMQSSLGNFSQLVADRLMTSRYERPILFFNLQEPLPKEEVIEAWIGQDAIEFMQNMEQLDNKWLYEENRRNDPWLDTLAVARANSIRAYLLEHQEQTGPVEILMSADGGNWYSPTVASSPETRFYNRKCHIQVSFHDPRMEATELAPEYEEEFEEIQEVVPVSPK